MTVGKTLIIFGLWTLLSIVSIEAFPAIEENIPPKKQAKQDDEDDGTTRNPINFGAQVAQIITGAFTGNIDSIIKGSFGFIEDPNVNKLSHNTWETLKGNPTETPPWAADASTTAPRPTQAAAAVEPAKPAPSPPRQQQPSQPAVVSAAAEPESIAPATSGSSSYIAPSDIYDPYSPGSSYYQRATRAPLRTTRATVATLAPLSVIEGTEQTETESEPEEPTTTQSSTDPDDEDEAEGISAEISEGTTAKGSSYTVNKNKATTAAAIVEENTTSGVTEGNIEVTTEDDDEDSDNFFGII